MQRTRRHRLWAASGAFLALVFFVPSSKAQNSDLTELRRTALEYEQLGQWEDALQLYAQLFELDRRSPEIRDRIRHCLRYVLQDRRYRDPSFRRHILRLSEFQALELYDEVLNRLQQLYLDEELTRPSQLLAFGHEEFQRALNDSTFRSEFLNGASEAKVQEFRLHLAAVWDLSTVQDARDARAMVSRVAVAAERHFQMHYPVAVIAEFMCGACNALDEYTAYLTPDQFEAETSQATLDLLAFGFQLGITGSDVVVVTVRPASPAADSFLQPGARLIAINGEPILDPTPESVGQALRRGDDGSMELEFAGSMGMPFQTVTVPPDLPSIVGAAMLHDRVGYFQILTFRQSTPAELEDAIITLQAQGMQGLVIDLRGNPGGLFPVAIEVTNRFLPGGVIVTTEGRRPEWNRTHAATSGVGAFAFPLAVLVDEDTASAAEAMAAALKENQRAVLVGMPTFGKGTIQVYLALATNDETPAGAVRLTIGRFFGPGDAPIERFGIMPTIPESVPERQLEVAIEQVEGSLSMMMP